MYLKKKSYNKSEEENRIEADVFCLLMVWHKDVFPFSYETLRYVLKCYCNMNDTSFNNIDKTFYEDFIIFLKETNIKDTTIVSYTKAFRTVLFFLWIENILKNLRLLFQKQIFL